MPSDGIERFAHHAGVAMVMMITYLRIRYGEPQHATRHLFQQCLLLRVRYPRPHTYSRAGLQSANEYISLFQQRLLAAALSRIVANDRQWKIAPPE